MEEEAAEGEEAVEEEEVVVIDSAPGEEVEVRQQGDQTTAF